MITRRKLLVGFGLGTLTSALPIFAQQAKVPRIGILSARSRSTPSDPDPYFDAFVTGMREFGYVEGKNLVIEWRFADGKYERLPALAAELVQWRGDVLVSHATPAVQALKRATNTIPIVMTSTVDPVGSGIVASLSRPGGNITGMSIISVDVSPKLVELLQIMVPVLSRVAFFVNPGTSYHAAYLKSVQSAAQSREIAVVAVEAGTPAEIERGFETLRRNGVNAAIFPADSFFAQRRRQNAELALRNRISTAYVDREDIKVGGLISYGPSTAESYRRAATYVDKILKGAKPGDLPIEQPTKFHLAINGKTAKALGLRIPQELLLRADEVIE